MLSFSGVCFVLFCFVLFCFVLFCFVLFCFVLFCFVFVFFAFIQAATLRSIVQSFFGMHAPRHRHTVHQHTLTINLTTVCAFFRFIFLPFLGRSRFFEYFVTLLPFPIVISIESTLYFSLPDGVFLPCDHGLDLDILLWEKSIPPKNYRLRCFHITSHYTTLHYTTLHHITSHHTRLHYTTLHVTLHYTTYNTNIGQEWMLKRFRCVQIFL